MFVPKDLMPIILKYRKLFYQLTKERTVKLEERIIVDLNFWHETQLLAGIKNDKSLLIDIHTGEKQEFAEILAIGNNMAISQEKGLVVSHLSSKFGASSERVNAFYTKNSSAQILEAGSLSPNAIVLSEDADLLVVTTDKLIKSWTIDSEGNFSKEDPTKLSVSSSGRFLDAVIHKKDLYTLFKDIDLSVWKILHCDLTSRKTNVYFTMDKNYSIKNFILDPVQERLFVSLTNDKQENQATIRMFDLEKYPDRADQFTATTTLINSDIKLAVSPDSKFLASLNFNNEDNTIDLYRSEDLTHIQSLRYNTDLDTTSLHLLENRFYITSLCPGLYYLIYSVSMGLPSANIDILKLQAI